MFLFVLCFGISILATTKAAQVCYDKYGCFNNDYPFNRYVDVTKLIPLPLPKSPEDVQTTYQLVTQSSDVIINDTDVAKLQASSYDGSKKTIVVIHGWTESVETSQWINDLKAAILTAENANLIIVEWKEGAAEFYTYSVANTRLVGAQIAELIKFLNAQTGNSPSSFHLIGFSLGAHVAGYAGRRLQAVKIGRITGLDPAGPYYHNEHIDVRLDATDADFVDVIHTDAGALGLTTRSGQIDFYPNGGRNQRGCVAGLTIDNIACDHLRATSYYIESVLSSCHFKGYHCSSWDDFTHGNCMACQSGCPEMGHQAVNMKDTANGEYYLYTNEQSPFCVDSYVYVTFKTSSGWLAGGRNPKIRIFGAQGDSGKINLEKRDLEAGSTERFIAPLKANLGALTTIEVWNDLGDLFDGWKLDQVTIQFVDGGQRYYACYNNHWIRNISPVERSFQSGEGNC